MFYGSYIKYSETNVSLGGWFRDYLWFNSGSLLNGYSTNSANDITVFSWAFLLGHFIWATGFGQLALGNWPWATGIEQLALGNWPWEISGGVLQTARNGA